MPDTPDCPYLVQVHRNLPRLLALFDRDRLAPTAGLGDRTYWAWKLKDFPNATLQGAASGLAQLLAQDLLPHGMSETAILNRIKSIIRGSAAATARNGSLAEALPNEGSFCVTALVAADILTAVDALGDRLSADERREAHAIVAPWIAFLHKQDEHHGVISNHLAVAVLALVLWKQQTGENCDARARRFLDRILNHRSREGWFLEYAGADPGYQSWLMSSLAAVHRIRPEWKLGPVLHEGARFLTHFAHPDGSYGGIYGSRMTRFCFPAGFETLAHEDAAAHAMASFLCTSIPEHRLVTLDAVDQHNLVPLFNDYVRAAIERAKPGDRPEPDVLPHASGDLRTEFPEAGLLIDGSARHYTVISLFKGGTLLHFRDGELAREDPGTVCTAAKQPVLTSQILDAPTKIVRDAGAIELNSFLRPVDRMLPTAYRFIILRWMSLTVFRSIKLGNLVKRMLAGVLVRGLREPRGRVTRRITLGPELTVQDTVEAPKGYKTVHAPTFRAVHMASQGYWQASDDAR